MKISVFFLPKRSELFSAEKEQKIHESPLFCKGEEMIAEPIQKPQNPTSERFYAEQKILERHFSDSLCLQKKR